MKLLAKNTLAYFFITLLVFLAGGFIFYFHLKKIINEESNENLVQRRTEVLNYIRTNNRLPEPDLSGQLLLFEKTSKPGSARLYDTLVYNQAEGETLPYRYLSFVAQAGGDLYKISVGKSMFEDEDLLETIIVSFLIITGILTVALLVFNSIASRLILKPFLKTLNFISNYNIETHEPLNLEKTSTFEFTELNKKITDMTHRVSDSYKNLKRFSENASHELQTPLAIIKTKSEFLIQSISNEDQLTDLHIINQTAGRVARLNQALLLLSKIENNQFVPRDLINFSDIVADKLVHYEELFKMKEILIIHKIAEVKTKMNPELAEILISNLLTNALKYTPAWGTVEIELTEKEFCVRNTGASLKSKGIQLFQRFYKESVENDSMGLGLSIVFEIAKASGHRVDYYYREKMHQFNYRFYN